jgi:hypothetical protein
MANSAVNNVIGRGNEWAIAGTPAAGDVSTSVEAKIHGSLAFLRVRIGQTPDRSGQKRDGSGRMGAAARHQRRCSGLSPY